MDPNVLKCNFEKAGLTEKTTTKYEVNDQLLWKQFKSGSESAWNHTPTLIPPKTI